MKLIQTVGTLIVVCLFAGLALTCARSPKAHGFGRGLLLGTAVMILGAFCALVLWALWFA
jgi:hypothetical protein